MAFNWRCEENFNNSAIIFLNYKRTLAHAVRWLCCSVYLVKWIIASSRCRARVWVYYLVLIAQFSLLSSLFALQTHTAATEPRLRRLTLCTEHRKPSVTSDIGINKRKLGVKLGNFPQISSTLKLRWNLPADSLMHFRRGTRSARGKKIRLEGVIRTWNGYRLRIVHWPTNSSSTPYEIHHNSSC